MPLKAPGGLLIGGDPVRKDRKKATVLTLIQMELGTGSPIAPGYYVMACALAIVAALGAMSEAK